MIKDLKNREKIIWIFEELLDSDEKLQKITKLKTKTVLRKLINLLASNELDAAVLRNSTLSIDINKQMDVSNNKVS